MRFKIISDDGNGLGIATHLASEGNAVNFALTVEGQVGSGIVSTPFEDELLDVKGVDFVVYGGNAHGSDADELRDDGRKVLGASRWARELEDDPKYKAKVIKLAGWDREQITNGTNLHTTVWFNGIRFISVYNSLVYKRFMDNGKGPDLGFTGCISNFQTPTHRVVHELLKPLEPILRRVNHRGCFNIHSVIAGDKFCVKDINASFNSPLALPLFENTRESTSDVLLKLLDENSKELQPLEHWASCVQISVPPFPWAGEVEGFVLQGIQTPALKHLWLVDALLSGKEWKTAGLHGRVGYITARGGSIQEACNRVYRTIKRLEVRDLQYREDVGKGVFNLVKGLRDSGWMK